MKKIAYLSLAALLGVACGSVHAQPPGGGRGGFGMMMPGGGGMGANPAMMLSNPAVREELKLSEEEVKAILDKYNEEIAGVIAKVMAEKAKPEQVARFKQIRTQQLGFAAFQDATIAKALKLTEDQTKEIKEIADEMRKEGEELRRSSPQEFFPKMQAMQKDAMTKALALLKDDQKKVWDEMTGKPFTMNFGGGRPRNRDQ